jgi:gluconokinase
MVMGVSGAGKTTVGRQLALRLGWSFVEGDSLHPSGNLAKMKSGEPLTDADRAPWLAAVAKVIDRWCTMGEHGVITCSALKRAYRWQIIGSREDVRLVYLAGLPDLIGERLTKRRVHFMPPSLLDSQFATLEPPGRNESPITVDIDLPVEKIVKIVESIIGGLCLSAQLPRSFGLEARGTP